MGSVLTFLGFVAFVCFFVFLIRGILKKPRAWRNAGWSAAAFVVLAALTPSGGQPDRTSGTTAPVQDATGMASEGAAVPETAAEASEPSGDSDQAAQPSPDGGAVDPDAGSAGVADANGDGVVGPVPTAASERTVAPSAAATADYTSPEADAQLKRLRSNLLPVAFEDARNVGGNTGDDLGAGLWMSAEAQGYQCHETEAYSSPSLEGLKADLQEGLSAKGYSYEELSSMGEGQGSLIVWKASGAGQVVIGFFATSGGAPGTMALCRATAV